MLTKKSIRTAKIGQNYIAECVVFDDEQNKDFYVVAQLGDLLYATFESSYIDCKKGKTDVEPAKIEGETYMWFDSPDNRFKDFYWEAYNEASHLEHKDHITRKYAHLKKPLNNIKYEIVEKKSKPVFGCGPMGDIYEIKFHILDDNSYLWVYSDDATGAFLLNNYSAYDALEAVKEGADEKIAYPDPIEDISDFSKAKKSKYYDLYLEVEKFRDGYKAAKN